MTLKQLIEAYMSGQRFYATPEIGNDATGWTLAEACENVGRPKEYFFQDSGGGMAGKLAEEIAYLAAGMMDGGTISTTAIVGEQCPDIANWPVAHLACLGGILKRYMA